MIKLLVTGSSGMLGKDIVEIFTNNTKFKIHGFDLIKSKNSNVNFCQHILDITDLRQLREKLEEIKPEIIIHTAAIVNLKLCEDNFSLANKIHVDVSREFAKTKAKIIYISTDSIFNGKKGDYSELAIPDPINNYAKTKYLGELAIQANNQNHIIIRTNIFGFNLPLKGSIVEWALNCFEKNEDINGFVDVFFNAIYTKHLAVAINQLVEIDFKGIINIGSTNTFSKYEFLRILAQKNGFQLSKIKETSIGDINFEIPRPTNTVLNIDKAQEFINLPSIEEGLELLIHDFKKNSYENKN